MQEQTLANSMVKSGSSMDIIIAPDPRLRIKAELVGKFDQELGQLIDAMLVTMERSNGIGLAATQVGVPKRVIVVDVEKLSSVEDLGDIKTYGRFELVNPMITSATGEMTWPEACLSVPGVNEEVKRSAFILVEGYDRTGRVISFKATGLLSACIQHEIDHLDGKLFIDRLSKLKRDLITKKLQKFRKTGRMVVRAGRALNF